MAYNYAPLVEYHLAHVYHEKVTNNSKMIGAMKIFREAVEADQGLRAAVQERRSQITDLIARRDFISKQHRDFMNEVLG